MSIDLIVLCRDQPSLTSGRPRGFEWSAATGHGSFRGFSIDLHDGDHYDYLLPDRVAPVAVLVANGRPRGDQILDVEAWAIDVASVTRGAALDPQQGEVIYSWAGGAMPISQLPRVPDNESSRHAKRQAYERASEAPLPSGEADLRGLVAKLVQGATTREERMLADNVLRRALDGPGGSAVSAWLERYMAEIALAGADLDRSSASWLVNFGCIAIATDPTLRARMAGRGPFADQILERVAARDADAAKARTWLRSQWKAFDREICKRTGYRSERPRSPLRDQPKGWSDELCDALLAAVELNFGLDPNVPFDDAARRAQAKLASAVFEDRLGMDWFEASEAVSLIRLKRR